MFTEEHLLLVSVESVPKITNVRPGAQSNDDRDNKGNEQTDGEATEGNDHGIVLGLVKGHIDIGEGRGCGCCGVCL